MPALDPGLRTALVGALQKVAGSARGVIYDVPASQRPVQRSRNAMSVAGSPAWAEYLNVRRRIDDGALTIVLSLRVLDSDERRLAIDWGSTYANSLLLVEPRERDCDLTDPANAHYRALHAILAALPRDADGVSDSSSHETALGRFLRESYGRWVYWPSPGLDSEPQEVLLDLRDQRDTIALRLLRELPQRFPQSRFDRSMAFLHFWERELFGGPVPRARSVFRTRLGLPILYDPYCADRAVRRLVNQGRMTVVGPARVPHLRFGFGSAIPDSMPDEEFEKLVMV